MGIGIFTLALGANESREAAITGEYFELRNALYPVTLIELLDRTGGVVARLDNPEQSDFVKPGRYETVRITNGSTAQTVKHFYGTGDAGSRRTSGLVQVDGTVQVMGDVSVIDGGKARTLSNLAFMASISKGVGSSNSNVQLWNPAATGRRLVVERLTCDVDSGSVSFGFAAAKLATAVGFGASKLSGGAASVGETAVVDNVPSVLANLGGFNPAKGGIYTFTEPLVVLPGYGLVIFSSSVAVGLSGLVEYFEEPV